MAIQPQRAAFNPAYTGRRDDILNLVPKSSTKFLDVGCSIGMLLEQIKQRNTNAELTGIEVDEAMADIAKQKVDTIVVGDVEKINFANYFSTDYFDCIIFADLLEHLADPWSVLKSSTRFLSKDGIIIASIPNVRHYTTLASLLFRGHWPYRNRGIHDRTHLRFFTLKNILELFEYARLRIVKIERNYRIIERPHSLNRYTKYFSHFFLKEFLTFQYLVVSKKNA